MPVVLVQPRRWRGPERFPRRRCVGVRRGGSAVRRQLTPHLQEAGITSPPEVYDAHVFVKA
jgi:hypothetical protein